MTDLKDLSVYKYWMEITFHDDKDDIDVDCWHQTISNIECRGNEIWEHTDDKDNYTITIASKKSFLDLWLAVRPLFKYLPKNLRFDWDNGHPQVYFWFSDSKDSNKNILTYQQIYGISIESLNEVVGFKYI